MQFGKKSYEIVEIKEVWFGENNSVRLSMSGLECNATRMR